MTPDRRVAVVTGGAHGIGLATAEALATDGFVVVIFDTDDAAGRAAVAGSPDLEFTACDVSDDDAVAAAIASVVGGHGRIDVLVNNAGIAHGPGSEQHFFDTSPQMWDRLVVVNLRGTYLCSSHAARVMAGGGRGGAIVNVSSAGATRAHRRRVAYDATKGAIEAATRALALDLAPWGIRVNAVAPGMIEVPNRTPVGPGAEPADRVVPLGRPGRAVEVAAAIRFLASAESSYVTGAVLTVDGGLSAQLRSPAVDVPVRPDADPDEELR